MTNYEYIDPVKKYIADDPESVPPIEKLDWTAFMLSFAVEQYVKENIENLSKRDYTIAFMLYYEILDDAMQTESSYLREFSEINTSNQYVIYANREQLQILKEGFEKILREEEYWNKVKGSLKALLEETPGKRSAEEYESMLSKDMKSRSFSQDILDVISNKDLSSQLFLIDEIVLSRGVVL